VGGAACPVLAAVGCCGGCVLGVVGWGSVASTFPVCYLGFSLRTRFLPILFGVCGVLLSGGYLFPLQVFPLFSWGVSPSPVCGARVLSYGCLIWAPSVDPLVYPVHFLILYI